jgi:hypothetical protein
MALSSGVMFVVCSIGCPPSGKVELLLPGLESASALGELRELDVTLPRGGCSVQWDITSAMYGLLFFVWFMGRCSDRDRATGRYQFHSSSLICLGNLFISCSHRTRPSV